MEVEFTVDGRSFKAKSDRYQWVVSELIPLKMYSLEGPDVEPTLKWKGLSCHLTIPLALRWVADYVLRTSEREADLEDLLEDYEGIVEELEALGDRLGA